MSNDAELRDWKDRCASSTNDLCRACWHFNGRGHYGYLPESNVFILGREKLLPILSFLPVVGPAIYLLLRPKTGENNQD